MINLCYCLTLQGNSSKYFLSIDFEKNPLNSEAEYGLNITSESAEIVYHEVFFFEILIHYVVNYLTISCFNFYSSLYLHYLVSSTTIKK